MSRHDNKGRTPVIRITLLMHLWLANSRGEVPTMIELIRSSATTVTLTRDIIESRRATIRRSVALGYIQMSPNVQYKGRKLLITPDGVAYLRSLGYACDTADIRTDLLPEG